MALQRRSVTTAQGELVVTEDTLAIHGRSPSNPNDHGLMTINSSGYINTNALSGNTITNTGLVTYNYTVNPSIPNGVSEYITTNIITTNIIKPGLTATKYVDKIVAVLGETIGYSIVLNNTGNIDFNNIVILDTLPNGVQYEANSFKINNIAVPITVTNIIQGNVISSLSAGSISTATFNVVVNTIPSPSSISNNASFTCNYTVDPSAPNSKNFGTNCTSVLTSLGYANLSASKYVDKSGTRVGDNLTYTVVVKNTGNIAADNTVFIDTVPSSLTLINNSVILNGFIQGSSNSNLQNGISISSINPGTVATIIFRVTVNTIPSPNIISNIGTVTYKYSGSQSSTFVVHSSINTNTSNISVNETSVLIDKAVDKAAATVGNDITYTLTLRNTGNVVVNNIKIIDTIPSGATFVANSIYINGQKSIGGNPSSPNGVTIPSISAGAMASVSFKINVVTVPSSNEIRNNASVTYSYTSDPSIPNGVTGGGNSNTVTTSINKATLSASKYVDKVGATQGDPINYKIVLKNNGNIEAVNVRVFDTIPDGTTLVSNSVVVNNVIVPGSNISGILLGTLPVSVASTIDFRVLVITIPTTSYLLNQARVTFNYTADPSLPNGESGNITTNSVLTNLGRATLSSIKYVDKSNAKIGDTLTYTIGINNIGNVEAKSVVFTDTIPYGVNFILDSVMVDNLRKIGVSPSPNSGVSIGTIIPGGFSTVSFQVTVATLPSTNSIVNSGTVSFNYRVDPSIITLNGVSNTNIVFTNIVDSNLEIVKFANKKGVFLGENITYTIVIKNKGNTPANNVILIDTIPQSMIFIQNSVILNGFIITGTTPNAPGISLGNLLQGSVSTLSFVVQANQNPTLNPVPNTATVYYKYSIDPSIPNSQQAFMQSNLININVANPGMSMVKTVNKAGVSLGDTINYSINLVNTGNVDLNNIVFIDTIPNALSIVNNSFRLNGIIIQGATVNPPGYTIPFLPVGGSSNITFSVMVNTIPSPDNIVNSATATYNYTLDPSIPNGNTNGTNSNSVSTKVALMKMQGTKVVDVGGATIGDLLGYTLTVDNDGNVDANNIRIIDTIPQGTTFVTNSIYINGVNMAAMNPSPPNGILLSKIASGQSASVSFKVQVNTLPSPNTIINVANIGYAYTIDSASFNVSSGSLTTNSVSTNIRLANASVIKYVDKKGATTGEILSYTIIVKNIGNTSINNVILVDTIPVGSTYIQGTLNVNNTLQSNSTPDSGVTLGNINIGNISTVTFQVRVESNQAITLISNSALVQYQYTVDEAFPNGRNATNTSNLVKTNIGVVNIISNQLVDKPIARVGDILTYTLVLRNTGNIPANSVVLTDTIGSGLSFIDNSLSVNYSGRAGANPVIAGGAQIGVIDDNSVTTIQFKAIVTTIPTVNPASNYPSIQYKYTLDPSVPNSFTSGVVLNSVSTKVVQLKFNAIKKANRIGVTKNDIITYNVQLSNTGDLDVSNVIIIDTIPKETSFIPYSIRIDGSSYSGSIDNGINVGLIRSGGISTISFQVRVDTIPRANSIINIAYIPYRYNVDPSIINIINEGIVTNTVNINAYEAIVKPAKFVDKEFVKLGDIIRYTINLYNSGSIKADNIVVIDTIPTSVAFINNSIIVDGIPKVGGTINPPGGLTINTLGVGSTSTITFDVTVNTTPNGNIISNSAITSYVYTVDSNYQNSGIGSYSSNIVTTKVLKADISVTESVDKDYAFLREILTYTVNIKNTGNILLSNVKLTSTIPNGISLENNSIKINGAIQYSASLQQPDGIFIGNIPQGNTITVTYQVKVNLIPGDSTIKNSSSINYFYTINQLKLNEFSGGLNSNEVITNVGYSSMEVSKNIDKTGVFVGETITYSIVVKNTGTLSSNNILLTDTIADATRFIENSVIVNGTTIAGAIPTLRSGIMLGNMMSEDIKTITFKVLVVTVPLTGVIENAAMISYGYKLNPNLSNEFRGGAESNIVKINVKNINFSLIKSVDKKATKVGEVLNYSISIKNTGNTSVSNIIITDTIPEATIFQANSVNVNGINRPFAIPQTPSGILIDNLKSGEASLITFKVIVVTIPSTNKIQNSASAMFYFASDTISTSTLGVVNSNIVETKVDVAKLIATKVVNKLNAKKSDILIYSIVIRNIGNIDANNVILIDTLPNGVAIVENSVDINGIYSGLNNQNPTKGIDVGTILSGQMYTVNFKVTVIDVPNPNNIDNNGTVKYNYLYDKERGAIDSVETTTNKISTLIKQAYLDGIVETVDKTNATLEDIITYTVTMKNIGNIPASNIIFRTTIPSRIALVSNSMTIDGITRVGGNPASLQGENIGEINPGNTKIVSFKVKVDTLPRENPVKNSAYIKYNYIIDSINNVVETNEAISNTVDTNIIYARISNVDGGFIKSVDKVAVNVDEVITYSILIKNTGNTAAKNVMFTDIIPNGSTFVSNSFKLDNVGISSADPSMGVVIGSINPNIVKKITFKVKANSKPFVDNINNSSKVSYSYSVSSNVSTDRSEVSFSNSVSTRVAFASISLPANVDKNYGKIGEILTNTIVLTNTGNRIAESAMFYSSISPDVQVIENSITINGALKQRADFSVGINLGRIDINGVVTISYKVKVQSISVTGGKISSNSRVVYNYTP